MTLEVILLVVKIVCVIAIMVVTVRLLEAMRKDLLGEGFEKELYEFKKEFYELKKDFIKLTEEHEYLQRFVDGMYDACEDFYDNEYIPFTEAHEELSKRMNDHVGEL